MSIICAYIILLVQTPLILILINYFSRIKYINFWQLFLILNIIIIILLLIIYIFNFNFNHKVKKLNVIETLQSEESVD